jgi:hypothetical protein
MSSFLYLLLSTAFATPYYGVDLDKIQNLKHQSFQSHELGWSGIAKEGLTRVYFAPNEESATLWIETMKKRHYKSNFIEVEDLADYTLWDEELVLISQFDSLLILVQGERVEERRTEVQVFFVTEKPVVPLTPKILKTNTGYRIGLESGWEYSFMGGNPVYQQDWIEFVELPEMITIWNMLARSHRFALVTENTILSYQLLPNEIPVLKPTGSKKSKPPTIKR